MLQVIPPTSQIVCTRILQKNGLVHHPPRWHLAVIRLLWRLTYQRYHNGWQKHGMLCWSIFTEKPNHLVGDGKHDVPCRSTRFLEEQSIYIMKCRVKTELRQLAVPTIIFFLFSWDRKTEKQIHTDFLHQSIVLLRCHWYHKTTNLTQEINRLVVFSHDFLSHLNQRVTSRWVERTKDGNWLFSNSCSSATCGAVVKLQLKHRGYFVRLKKYTCFCILFIWNKYVL